MKYYVIFKKDQYHKLGSIELGPNNVAVFDVESVEQGKEITKELFGNKIQNQDNWPEKIIESHAESNNKIFVNINSEI